VIIMKKKLDRPDLFYAIIQEGLEKLGQVRLDDYIKREENEKKRSARSGSYEGVHQGSK
jgi:S-adenosylmethionine:tRNA-ribosyltransferase-isomerase (queuine synthetase)